MIRFTNPASTLQTSLMRRRTAAELTARLGRAEQEVATGRKSDVFRAIGLRSAQVISLRAGIDRTEGMIAANTQLSHRLDAMADAMGAVREAAQKVLALAVPNLEAPNETAAQLQLAARSALDAIIGKLNGSFQGVALFGGIDTAELPLQGWDKAAAATGLSPRQVMEAILGGGLADAADAAAKAAEVTAAFANTSATAAWNFDSSFYNGAPRSAAHLSARIDDAATIEYGVQANDPAYAGILQGLAMLAVTDVAQIADAEAYKAWIGAAADALSVGVKGGVDSEARLGAAQAQLKDVTEAQKTRQDIYKSQVLDLEGVDPYEAASRVSLLQSQLQASYAVTARLQSLSFLNFMY